MNEDGSADSGGRRVVGCGRCGLWVQQEIRVRKAPAVGNGRDRRELENYPTRPRTVANSTGQPARFQSSSCGGRIESGVAIPPSKAMNAACLVSGSGDKGCVSA